jgi:hypothetical protein
MVIRTPHPTDNDISMHVAADEIARPWGALNNRWMGKNSGRYATTGAALSDGKCLSQNSNA